MVEPSHMDGAAKRAFPDAGPASAPSIEECAEAVRSGRKDAFSSVREALERVTARESNVRAWVHLDQQGDRRAAMLAIAMGRLAGVPFGVKDLIDVAGMPTALGLTAGEYQAAPAARSAIAVQRLEAEGAVAIGKTVTTALALDRPGPTRNPLDPSRSPGASSSGSAAAVAAGMVPLALGSQAVGSVIRPASYCGVWAFVPSHGAVPGEGSLILSPTLDRIGIFASTPAGLRLAGLALLGRDEQAGDAQLGKKCRIAVLMNEGLASRAPEPSRHLHSLLRDHSDRLFELRTEIDFTAVLDATRVIAAYELNRSFRMREPFHLAALNRALVTSLTPAEPAENAYRAALSYRDGLIEAWERLAGGFDAVLLPSAAAEAPSGTLDDQDGAPAALGSLLGLPAISMPLFLSVGGLPLGCQLLAARDADDTALAIAGELALAFSPGAAARAEYFT